MKTATLSIFLTLLLLSGSTVSAQFGDPDFYLLDSIEVEELSDWDSILLDTSLTQYHQTKEDTDRLEILKNLVWKCWDEEVWPRYNDLIIEKVQNNLSLPISDQERRKNKYYLADAISNLGFTEDQKGDYGAALDYYHEALRIHEEIEDKQGAAVALNNIAVIQSVLGDYDKALQYQERSLEFKKAAGDKEGTAISYINIGHTFYDQGDNFKALDYYKRGLEIGLEYDNKRTIAMAYARIGDIHVAEDVLPKAVTYYEKSLANWEIIQSEVGLSTTLNALAGVLLQQGKVEEARQHAERSFDLSEKLGFPQDISNSAKTLSDIFEVSGNHQKSLYYYRLYTAMREKLVNVDAQKKAYRMAMQYEYEQESLKDSLEYQKKDEISKEALKTKRAENYVLYGGVLLLLVIMGLGGRTLRHRKKVNELTRLRQEEAERQKNLIAFEHQKLSTAHKEISDSITYAERIQRAILPSRVQLNELLGDAFVLFRPKNVVSGDFYWLEKIDDGYILAVADCTGHGVPGALVSVVCNNALNRSVREFGLRKPSEILNKAREIVVESLSASNENVKDGMDISLCTVYKKENRLEFAGAYNPLYIIKTNGELNHIKGDRQPIGQHKESKDFTNHELTYEEEDHIFLFTDGYPDQFGGNQKGKLKYSRFKDLLKKGISLSPEEQKVALNTFFDEWKGDLEQIDDVCIIGVKL